jgi:hypothetical protein
VPPGATGAALAVAGDRTAVPELTILRRCARDWAKRKEHNRKIKLTWAKTKAAGKGGGQSFACQT